MADAMKEQERCGGKPGEPNWFTPSGRKHSPYPERCDETGCKECPGCPDCREEQPAQPSKEAIEAANRGDDAWLLSLRIEELLPANATNDALVKAIAAIIRPAISSATAAQAERIRELDGALNQICTAALPFQRALRSNAPLKAISAAHWVDLVKAADAAQALARKP